MSGKPTHGLSHTGEYQIWHAMKARCYDLKNKRYSDYGGRGIAVCDRWRNDALAFVTDMGPRPPGMMIDRIDNGGNYEPGNCRWATRAQQMSNMRSNRHVVLDGETLTLANACRKLGISATAVRTRLCRGWKVDDALMVPVGVETDPTTGRFLPKHEFAAARRGEYAG